jgi:hypothetical protein
MLTRKLCLKQIPQVRKNEQRSDRSLYAGYRLKMIPSGIWRFLPALVLCALLLQSCGSDIKPTEPPWTPGAGSGPDTAKIFPLAVGNKWIYDWPWVSDSVTASVIIDGKEYCRMRGSSLEIVGMPAHVRLNDQQQLVVRSPAGGEQVFFDFGAEPGSTWDYVWPETGLPYTATLDSRLESVTVPAGGFKDCYLFVFRAKHAVDANWGFWIAPQVGIVKFGGGKGVKYELVEFIRAKK